MAVGAGTRKRKIALAGGGASSSAAGSKKRAAPIGGTSSTAAGTKKRVMETSIGWIDLPPTSSSTAPSRGRRTLAADLAPSHTALPAFLPLTPSREYTLTPWSSPASSPDHAASTSSKSTPSTPSSYTASPELTRTPWNSPESSPDHASSIPSSPVFAPCTLPRIRSAASPDYTPPAPCNSPASPEQAPWNPLIFAALPDNMPPAPCNSPTREQSWVLRIARTASTQWNRAGSPC